MKNARVLIVDPDEAGRKLCRETLQKHLAVGEVVGESTLDAAVKRLRDQSFDLAIVAIDPPRLDGVGLLQLAKQADPQLPVLMLAAAPDVASASASMRFGASDYLTKPLSADAFVSSARRLLEQSRLGAENQLLRRQVERPYIFEDIIGTSPAMRKVFATIEQVAGSNVDVLVMGETGTGKELIARAIHRRSPRVDAPFVPVDCGAIPDNLLESELFGHERGAFTGADNRRIGLLEFADGGTFFLDELGELPQVLQAKLLRTLQERKVRRVGGHEEVPVDVRVVAATARDLDAMIRQGSFRQDLYYRINVVRIDLPPLRNRGDDIGLLAEYFSHRHSREMGKKVVGITPEAYQVLAQYRWPGNVRELQNVIRRGIALTQATMIGLDDLPDELVATAGRHGSGEVLGYFELRDRQIAHFEKQYLTELLTRHHGDVRTASDEAKLPRGTLYRLMKNHGLEGNDFRVAR